MSGPLRRRGRRYAPWLALLGCLPQLAAAQPTDELDCLIEPRQSVVLSAAVIGVVESVEVERGDVVQTGQVLARLEAGVERATLRMAEARAEATAELEATVARLALEERRLARSRQLYGEGVVSDVDVDEAESAFVVAQRERDQAQEQLELARIDVERARAALELRILRSPVDGVVVRRILAPGEYADPPQLLELAEIDPLRVEVFAPVSLLGTIRVGMRGQVIPEAPVGGSHEAEVVIVDRVVDAASGTFGVRLELPNPDHSLPAGLKCRVRF